MINLTTWMPSFLQAVHAAFGERIWFIGLQGSYARKEATETSDIDVVVILDQLSPHDIDTYSAMLDTLPYRKQICGFLGGKQELLCWEPMDLFQFYYDTIPLQGSLDQLIPMLHQDQIRRGVKMGACNLYHGCVHNMVHEKSDKLLKSLYKNACFVIQGICFLQKGEYVRRLTDLREKVAPPEQEIVDLFLQLKAGKKVEFHPMSHTLFTWAKGLIAKTE